VKYAQAFSTEANEGNEGKGISSLSSLPSVDPHQLRSAFEILNPKLKTMNTNPIDPPSAFRAPRSTLSVERWTLNVLPFLLLLLSCPGTQGQPILRFGAATYPVIENAGRVTLTVRRTGDLDTAVSVDFATADGTARTSLDYAAAQGTLTFAAGVTNHTLEVPILNDGIVEQAERFTVEVATSNLTARAGVDCVGTNDTLGFAEGEMVKTLTVPIVSDEVPEPDRSFRVTLSNPTGGALLGTNATATVTIVDTTGMRPHRFDGIALRPDRSVELVLGGGVHTRFGDYYDLYPIEVSSNLVDWAPLVTLQRTNVSTNTLTCTDGEAGNWPTRFYRTPGTNLITPFFLKPTGPFPVGVVSRLLTDPSRRNRYHVSTNSSFMASVWYPAVAQAGRVPRPLAEPPLARDFAVWGAFLDRLPYLVSHALPDAPCAPQPAPYPVVLYSHGWGGIRAYASEKGPNLASHGYVVVAADHFDTTGTVFPDGTYLKSGVPTMTTAGAQDRARDLVFIVDELARWNASDPLFAGRLDLTRVAAMGGSWGAQAAAEFCRIDPRCKAVIPLDPGGEAPPGLLQYGVQKPLLEITSSDIGDTALYSLAVKDAMWFQIQGAAHSQVTCDIHYWFSYPSDLARGRETARTINAYALWFLNQYLKGSNSPMPALARYPLVTGITRK
jgi:dienelactone hydrolase